MTTANILPNGDNNVNWNKIGSEEYHFQVIDETTPDTLNYVFQRGDLHPANVIEHFNMASTDISGGVVTQIDVKVYHFSSLAVGATLGTVDIYIGSWQGTKELQVGDSVWTTYSWTGLSATQTQLDGLQVKFVSGDMGSSSNCVTLYDQIFIYAMYVVVTYTSGYTHEFLTVASGDIDSINGIATINIDSVKGV